MGKIYYHVVTDREMHVGDEIIFDDNHHSGVYNRVYALKDEVDSIYANPSKYKDMVLSHHLKVALRELALEEVRKKKYPNYPSRLASLYVSNTLEEAEKWYDLFISLGRPTYAIVKVEAFGNEYVGDAYNCFDGTINKEENLRLAEYYWLSRTNNIGKEPIVEIIIDGKIKVIQIVKRNSKIR